jgi:hypothetical protein
MIDVDEREIEVVCEAILESRLSAKLGVRPVWGGLASTLGFRINSALVGSCDRG